MSPPESSSAFLPQPDVAAVLLAAGRSSRMGFPKMMADLEGKPLVRRTADIFLAAGVGEVVVVTGYYRAEVEQALAGLPVRPVFNPEHHLDMAVSVRVGLAAVSPAARIILLTPADHPFLRSATIAAILAACRSSIAAGDGARIFLPTWQGRRGHPLALLAALVPEVLTAPPGWTLRTLLAERAGRIREVPVADPGIRQDVDTPADLCNPSAT